MRFHLLSNRQAFTLSRVSLLAPLVLLAGCQFIDQILPKSGPEPIDLSTLEFDNDLNYQTDYSHADICSLSVEQPAQTEPVWVEPESIWPRITIGFQLPQEQHPRLDAELNWYLRNPSYMARVSKRSERYIHYVTEQIEARGMPTELALLPIVESAYDPFAYSHGRASGMWQFIPGTAKAFKLDHNWWYDGRRDVVASTDAALNYLEQLHKRFDDDWLLALAAYNSGQGTVGRAIRKNRKAGKATDFWSLDLPNETRSYVPKLLALAKLVDHPKRYGMSLYPVPNQPYFETVDTQSQIDLAEAAQLAGIDIEELYRLNPGFNRWATAPQGPHQLLVPVEVAEYFADALAELPSSERLHWKRYIVKNGDSLLLLAKRYNTGVSTIKEINNLKGNMIRAGQALMIPVASATDEHYALSAKNRHSTIQQSRTGGKNSQQVFYTVKEGDSFWLIAKRHHVSVGKLAHWNGLSPRDTLRPGQKLSIWTQAKTTVSIGKQRKPVTRRLGYTVRNGDSLAKIANKFNINVNDIISWNKVNPDQYIQPGQRLTLYVNAMRSGS